MKHLKMLWAAALAMVAALALASPASATSATSPAGTVYTGTLAGESTGHVVFHNAFTTIECNAAVEGNIESHGTSVTGKGKSTKWQYINCTNSITIESVTTGTIEIHTSSKGVGTITSTGTKGAAIFHTFGGTCIYETSNTDLGTVTDSSITGGKAKIDLSATISRTGGTLGVFCGATATMTGSAIVNTPATIFID